MPGTFEEAGMTVGTRFKCFQSCKTLAALRPLSKLWIREVTMWRKVAATALGRIGDVRAVGPLIKALSSADNGTRENAAWSLGRLGDRHAIEPLFQAWSNGLHDAVFAPGCLGRSACLRALDRGFDARVSGIPVSCPLCTREVRRPAARSSP